MHKASARNVKSINHSRYVCNVRENNRNFKHQPIVQISKQNVSEI